MYIPTIMTPSGQPTILFVEDDPGIIAPLSKHLMRADFNVVTAMSVKEAVAILGRMVPDFVILDLGLADNPQGGVIVMSEIRKQGLTPVMIHSADSSEDRKELMYDLGADIFEVKGEVSASEMVRRIKSILRLSQHTSSSAERMTEPVQVGDLRVDPAARTATLAGEQLLLSKKEFNLLLRLLEDRGKVVSRDDLMNDVWMQDYPGDEWGNSTKTLDVHVGWLRRKLGDDPNDPKYLFTVRGVGFRFAAPEEVESV